MMKIFPSSSAGRKRTATSYEIAEALTQLGFPVSAALVCPVLADYGLAKKTPDAHPLPARLLAEEEIEILDGACKPHPHLVTRHDIKHDVTALLKRGLTTTSAGGFFLLPSPSPQYRFLQAVPVQSALDFQTVLGRRLVAHGQVTPGQPVNVDGHTVKAYSRQAMKHAFIS
jgi:hypothetical protein